jgi:hypothetical protein
MWEVTHSYPHFRIRRVLLEERRLDGRLLLHVARPQNRVDGIELLDAQERVPLVALAEAAQVGHGLRARLDAGGEDLGARGEGLDGRLGGFGRQRLASPGEAHLC